MTSAVSTLNSSHPATVQETRSDPTDARSSSRPRAVKEIFERRELHEGATVKRYLIASRKRPRDLLHYNPDVILAVGYRVVATALRDSLLLLSTAISSAASAWAAGTSLPAEARFGR